MKVRVRSIKKNGGTVQTGLVDYELAISYKKVLDREYPNDKHEIIVAGKKKRRGYQKSRVKV